MVTAMRLYVHSGCGIMLHRSFSPFLLPRRRLGFEKNYWRKEKCNNKKQNTKAQAENQRGEIRLASCRMERSEKLKARST